LPTCTCDDNEDRSYFSTTFNFVSINSREFPPTNVPQLAYGASKAALDSFSFGLVHDLADTGVALNLLAPIVLTESVEYHLTGPRFDDLKQRMAAMGPFGEAVARIADQPSSFRGHYLENHDLEALGFLEVDGERKV